MNSETQAVYDALAATKGKTLYESANFAGNRDQLLADLRLVVADADRLIREAAGASSEGVTALQTRLEAKLAEARMKFARARAVVGGKAHEAGAAVEAYARAKPWHAAAVLVAAGTALGVSLARHLNASASDGRVE
jgi:ElaB/YqjD/DUF883 family membrane-anchored ribosome-binding protein